jgi:enoyl-CoA hydratase
MATLMRPNSILPVPPAVRGLIISNLNISVGQTWTLFSSNQPFSFVFVSITVTAYSMRYKMTISPPVSIERDGPVTTVIIERPEKRNAVNNATAEALHTAFCDFEHDPDASVAVLWGRGPSFCAGADLAAVAGGERAERYEHIGDAGNSGTLAQGPMGPTRLQLSKPVIAAVAGYAVAGGIELALWCDLRVMEESATFGVFCRRFGVPLIDGGTVRLPRLIGESRAMDLILTGRSVGADEALTMGLANRVVADGTSRAQAEKLAHELAVFPQACMRTDRANVREQWNLNLQSALQHEFQNGIAMVEAEGRDGAQRFVDGVGRHGSFDEGEKT